MDWLTREILPGFQKLICLSLDRAPAADLIDGTVMAWVDALSAGRQWDEARDTPRIRQGFTALMTKCRQWPAPSEFVECLPAIRDQFVALPHTKPADPERVKRLFADAAKVLGASDATH